VKKILVYGVRWCGDCKRALRIFNERQIEIEWIDIDQDKEGEAIVKAANNGNRSVPTIIFPDDSKLVEPSNQLLVEKLESLGL
jgi:mycoredoxin